MTISKKLCLLIAIISFLCGCSTMTPLTKAAASGDVTAINTLLKEGKGVNEASKGKYYASPLHWAARYGHIEAVKLLLDAGANINGNDYCNQTPLIYAIYGNSNGGIEIAKVLIARGADTESLDCFGWKAINYAKQSNNNTITNLIESNNVLAKKTGIDDPDFMPDQYTIDLKGSIPKINFRSNKKITVVVYDKRSYVIAGNTKPEYLGFIQNYTRPLTEMTTANKRPLAEVLANNIAYGFKDAGFEIAQIIYGYRDNDKFKIENFKQNKSEQIIVLTIKEWLSDAGYNIGFSYDVNIEIINKQGIVTTTSLIKGLDTLTGYEAATLEVRSKLLVPTAAQKLLTELLNKPEIAAALR